MLITLGPRLKGVRKSSFQNERGREEGRGGGGGGEGEGGGEGRGVAERGE